MAGKREADIGVKITGDASRFQKVAYQVSKDVSKMQKDFHSFGRGLSQLKGLIAGAFSIKVISDFTKSAINSYDQQAKAEQSLLIALKGRKDIQQGLIRQASELQGKTLFGDEQTVMAMSRMAMVIGVNESAIKRLIPLVQDLAQAKFEGNLATAADLVAKSIGSSTNALRRYGIEIEGTVGSTKRLESAIEGLNRQVGGQAEAAAKVGLGPLTQLKNAWDDLKEVIGGAIVNSDGFKKSVSGLTGLVKDISDRGILSVMFEKRSTWEKWKADKEKWDIKPEDLPYVGKGTMLGQVDIVGDMKKVDTTISDIVEKIKEGAVESLNMAKAWKVIKDEINATHRAAGLGKISTDNLSIPTLGTKSQLAGLQRSNIDIKPFYDLEAQLDKDAMKANLLTDSIIGIGDAIAGIASGSIGAMKAMVSAVLSAIRQIINAYLAEAIAGIIKGETSKKGIAGIVTAAIGVAALQGFWASKVPEFASGTSYAPGGLALVGERGPEVVDLPRGSKVFPNGKGPAMRVEVVGRISGRDLVIVQRRNGF